jgi:anti-sigma factor RsiW
MTIEQDITCRELIDFLGDYLDGRLEPDRRRCFEDHLRVCRSCVDYLAAYQRTVALGREALASGADADVQDVPPALLEAIKASLRERSD